MNNQVSSIKKGASLQGATKSSAGQLFKKVFKKALTVCVLRKLYLRYWHEEMNVRGLLSNRLLMIASAILAGSALVLSGLSAPLPAMLFGTAAVIVAMMPLSRIVRRQLSPFLIMHRYSQVPAEAIDRDALITLGLSKAAISDLEERVESGSEVVIAEWDRNNRVCSKMGSIRFARSELISSEEFRIREKNNIALVWVDGRVAVRKVYDSRACFYNELAALDRLAGLKYVPRLLRVDVMHKTLYMEHMEGVNLGLLFGAKGVTVATQYQETVANILSDHTKTVMRSLLTEENIAELKQMLVEIHRRGVALRDVKYGNILLSSEGIRLVDFDAALTADISSYELFKARSEDIATFNRLFDTSIANVDKNRRFVTEASAESYAPIYIGKGVSYGRVGSIEFGTGKWLLMQPHLPDFKDKRVIDLGSNNGNLPLEILRAGASHVKGFELNPNVHKMALRNHELYQLVDNKTYSFDLVNDYMHGVLSHNIEDYDIATAFCSIYYESVDYMRQITRYLSDHVSTFIVQANENTDEHNGAMLERSSIPYLQNLLRENGFKQQRVVRWPFYDRPMIIATSDRCQA